MGIFDHEEKLSEAKSAVSSERKPILEICMPGAPEGTYVELGESQINRKFEEERGSRLILVLDEIAELLQPTNVKTEAGKQEDALKQEIVGIIQSLTQLGRSAGVHMILCTQRNDAFIAANYELIVERGGKKENIKWEDLQLGDKFEDGSECINLGEWQYEDCYRLESKDGYLDASATHLLKVVIKDENGKVVNDDIATEYWASQVFKARREYTNEWYCVWDLKQIFDKTNYTIYNPNGTEITAIDFLKSREKCRCICTDTGHYAINNFISSNSILPGVIQNNALSLNTKLKVRRLSKKTEKKEMI